MARKLVCLAFLAICFLAVAYAEETSTSTEEEDCDKLCDLNGTEFTGRICGKVDEHFVPFVNDCKRRIKACQTKKDVPSVEASNCNFPADFGVDPKWIG